MYVCVCITDVVSHSEKGQDTSDDSGSRSTSIHSNKPPRPSQAMKSLLNESLKKSRKRKRRKKASGSRDILSQPGTEILAPAGKIVEDLEDPLSQRRSDVLRGGAEQAIIKQQSHNMSSFQVDSVSVTELESEGVKKCCTRKITIENFKKKKNKRRWSLRCGRRGVSLPWSQISQRHRQLQQWRRHVRISSTWTWLGPH